MIWESASLSGSMLLESGHLPLRRGRHLPQTENQTVLLPDVGWFPRRPWTLSYASLNPTDDAL